MKQQKYTSAETSINSTRLPKAYRYQIPKGSTILDYGCGRYTDHLQKDAESRGLVWYGYDPYNRSEEQNRSAVDLMEGRKADFTICSNVLNVIDSDDAVMAVIESAVSSARWAAIFTVYEGDRSGHGRQTGHDQYQRNQRKAEYVAMMQAAGYEANRKGDYIIVRP